MKNVKGYPRPVLPKDGHNTPMPWLGAEGPETDNWARIAPERAIEAEQDRKCIVCGLELSSDFVYMLAQGEASNRVGFPLFGELPTPTWVHPKCGVIAATYCPHLKSEFFPAMTQNGLKLTHQRLKEIARNSDKPGK